MKMKIRIIGFMLAGMALPALGPSRTEAAVVNFSGLVVNVCVLTLSTPGVLAAAPSGTMLASTEAGGVSAIMTVVATGTRPTIQFSVPQATGPVGWTGTPTSAIAYTSLSGANQSFTSSASSATANALLDTFTINGRIINASGFESGTYGLATTATCQQ